MSQILIIYGSQTGNAAAVAHWLHRRLVDQFPDASFHISEADRLLNDECELIDSLGTLILITSTTGKGDHPDNSAKLYKHLHQDQSVKVPFREGLRDKPLLILGLGDQNYDSFNEAKRKFENLLTSKYGMRAVDLGVANEADDAIGLELVVEPWLNKCLEHFRHQFGCHGAKERAEERAEERAKEPAEEPGEPLSGRGPDCEIDGEQNMEAVLLVREVIESLPDGGSVMRLAFRLSDQVEINCLWPLMTIRVLSPEAPGIDPVQRHYSLGHLDPAGGFEIHLTLPSGIRGRCSTFLSNLEIGDRISMLPGIRYKKTCNVPEFKSCCLLLTGTAVSLAFNLLSKHQNDGVIFNILIGIKRREFAAYLVDRLKTYRNVNRMMFFTSQTTDGRWLDKFPLIVGRLPDAVEGIGITWVDDCLKTASSSPYQRDVVMVVAGVQGLVDWVKGRVESGNCQNCLTCSC